MASQAKVEANQRKALKSTGPRTPAGEMLAECNALRHGVLTAAPLVPSADTAAYDRRCRGMADSLAPAGAPEAAFADRVTLALWRLARLARAEALAAARRLESLMPKKSAT